MQPLNIILILLQIFYTGGSASWIVLDTLYARKPAYTILREYFLLRPQLGFMQVKIVHSTDTHNAKPWKSRADPVHKRTTSRAEVVRHIVSGSNCVFLTEGLQVITTTYMLYV